MQHEQKFLVAVAQLEPAKGPQAAIDRIAAVAADAARQGARLLLLPEAYLGGYPRGGSFGALVGQRTQDGREAFRRYGQNAIQIPGKECDQLARIARQNALQLVVGVIERDGGTLYCTVVFFSAQGDYLGKHRKLMPTGSEKLIWGFGNGSTLPVFDTPLGKVGAVICWENYMPLMRMAHYAQGIEIYCAPTADGRETWLPTVRMIALEGRCFVLSCNQFARKRHYPEYYDLGEESGDEIVSRGGSCIIDPFGTVLAGPDFDGEALLVAEVDRAAIPRAKFDFDAVGHYSRPDVFSLHVNTQDTKPVRFDSGT